MPRNGYPENKIRSERKLRILFFLGGLILLLILFSVFSRTEPLKDFSSGRYGKTFQTTHRPLQRELIYLQKEGFFNPAEQGKMIPAEFVSWYKSPETYRIISGELFRSSSYEKLILESLSSGIRKKILVFSDPFENPVPGDLFRTLLWWFDGAMRRNDADSTISALESMYCFTSLMLSSNAPEIYFAEKTLACSLEFEEHFSGKPSVLDQWSSSRKKILKKYVFSGMGLYQADRLRSMRDFEKIRLNGIRLFDGRPVAWSQMKEGIITCSPGQMISALKTMITDFFYDVDRDQTLNLNLYREILFQAATTKSIKAPDRKMSIRSIRRLRHNENVLSSFLTYLWKEP